MVPTVEKLLALWSKTREPRIADVLDAIARATPQLPLPSAKKADLKKWLAWMAARSPEEVPSVIAASAASSPQPERIAALDRFEPDPRIGRYLIAMIERYRPWSHTPKDQRTHEHLFALVEKHADPEIVQRLAKLAAKRLQDTGYVTSSEWFDDTSTALATRLRAITSSGDEALRERCDGWIAALQPKPAGTRDELFAAVYAAPDDDGPREVLADLLQREDDPHGELIALQLAQAAGRGDAKIDARVKVLIREHGPACSSPAVFRALAAKSVKWERGFVAGGLLAPRSAKAFAEAIDAPAWATVHTLQPMSFAGWGKTASDGTRMLELLTAPAMKHLRRVGPICVDEAALLVEHGVPLPWTVLAIATRNAREDVSALARGGTVFGKVEHLYLHVSPGALAKLLDEAAWLTRLKRLTLVGDKVALGNVEVDQIATLHALFGTFR